MKLYINSRPEITHYGFSSRKVKKDMRLAVIADLHNCMCEDKGRRLFSVIKNTKPDVVVIAGDLIESVPGTDVSDTMEFLKLLAGSFYVIFGVGNHERKVLEDKRFFAQRGSLAKGLGESGLKLLSNKAKIFKEHNIKISCIDLPISYFARFKHVPLGKKGVEDLMGPIDRDFYNILIAHDPSHFKSYSDYGSDLVLSGHVHGGVIRLPILGGVVSPELSLFPEYDAGRFYRKDSVMLVSKGLGSHTIHVRVNDPPELMIVDIKKR